MRQRKFKTNYTISKKEVSIYVGLINEYFDEETVIDMYQQLFV